MVPFKECFRRFDPVDNMLCKACELVFPVVFLNWPLLGASSAWIRGSSSGVELRLDRTGVGTSLMVDSLIEVIFSMERFRLCEL